MGIDEFALHQGHVYATALVDIENRRPIDLLPDHAIETVRSWLATHPECRSSVATAPPRSSALQKMILNRDENTLTCEFPAPVVPNWSPAP
jgi:hypothetical protein